MARPTKERQLGDIHKLCLAEFNDIEGVQGPERELCADDRRFYSLRGAQWSDKSLSVYENRPKPEFNRAHLAVMRIINEWRQNRITVDFLTKDGSDDENADVCDGLYRADEEASTAKEAYDNAFEEAAGGGFGAWRLRAVYEDPDDEENEHQCIRFEPIFDADTSVYFDLNSKRQDKRDAKSCYVLTAMSMDAYEETYGDNPQTWPKSTEGSFQWVTAKVVYVAEVYRVEERKRSVFTYDTISGLEEKYTQDDFERDEDLPAYLASIGTKLVRERKIIKKRVRRYVMSGGGILEDDYIAGPNIPIIPVYGKRWFVDGVERCAGAVRMLRDPQVMLNMLVGRIAEVSALSPIAKPIFLPEQVLNHSTMWTDDNVKNYPYLMVDAVTNADGNKAPSGPVGFTQPPDVPPATAALFQIVEQNFMEIMGNQQQGEQANPNLSGKAVELIQTRLDMQAYIYMSNMAKAISRCGEVWLGMARELYVEPGRKMRAMGDQGDISTIELQRPVQGDDGAVEYENDISKANFDVTVDVGPTSSTKRSATVRSLMNIMPMIQDPQMAQAVLSVILMNHEGEGIQSLRDAMRKKLVASGVEKPTDEEAEEMAAAAQQQQPDPQTAYFLAAAEGEKAKAIKAGADAENSVARAALAKAETIATLSEIDQSERRGAVDTARAISDIMQTPQPSGGQQTGEVMPTPPGGLIR